MDNDLADSSPSKLPAQLPAQLRVGVEQKLSQFRDTAGAQLSNWLDTQLVDQEFSEHLYRVWSGSEFVALTCLRQPELFQTLVESGDLSTGYDDSTLHSRCFKTLQEETATKAEREAGLHRQLRYFRRYEMLRIIWRDLSRSAGLIETTRDMSRLADAVIQVTLDKLHDWLGETWGRPVGATSGTEQRMLVVAMGKLGADELNVSSDIDLIFAYPEVGETQGAAKQLGNQEFFIRLAQKLIQALDNQTAEGQVFRVDMRLRPYGTSGALVLSFDALEEYYQTQGRDWERYAMIKSRVINSCLPGDSQLPGDSEGDEQALTQILRAFTYRRYTDFSAIQSLRDMKGMINLEVQRRGLANNIKLGHGGIREVEFIAQAFQLIRGGRDPRFQSRRLQDILSLLDAETMLPDSGGERLWQAYVFLRNLEHVLQGWRDQQTQELPSGDENGELDRLRVAAMMGFANWAEFIEALDRHRLIVSELFQELVAEQEGSPSEHKTNVHEANSETAWNEPDGPDARKNLEALGYDDAQTAAERLEGLRNSQKVSAMAPETRERLDKLMPIVIAACALMTNSAETLARVLILVESVARRSAYLVLLIENQAALKQLVALCAASPWISQSLSRHPVLLDELLDARSLFAPPDRQQLSDELRQHLLRIPEDDLEAQMEALRYFRLAHGLRVAACEVMEVLPLMKVSDHLTCLAEVILEEVVSLAWQQLTAKHGLPGSLKTDLNADLSSHSNPGPNPNCSDFLVLAYGKLGGIELGHGSDLDLVFLHDTDASQMTTGERSIANETFFVRLGQRVIHILNTVTPAGVLYEVDMRLRPSGNSGLLVSSIEAFDKYQEDNAWTWEHQALVRARPVVGDPALAAQFTALRRKILMRERDNEVLKRDVVAMRKKMAEHLGLDTKETQAGRFDLKQDPGGIVDIEFMVQFAVLAQAHISPGLTQWSDNIRLLAALSESGVLTPEENRQLTDAYIAYRSAGHRLQLQAQPNQVAAAQFEAYRQSVLTVWQKLFEGIV
jgi:glutamate-ammonia-ligase adenylyltransferase